MNYKTTYRKALAASLLLLIFAIDLAAVHQLFPNFIQVALFGGILGVQTLLILAYHQRCLECEGCMAKASAGIYLFYQVYAAIGFFSMLLIFLADVLPFESHYLKIGVATTYAALLITGVSTAFKAIIGVRNFSNCGNNDEKPLPDADTSRPKQETFRDMAKKREEQTLAAWDLEEKKRREKSFHTQEHQKTKRHNARSRARKVGARGNAFKFPHLP